MTGSIKDFVYTADDGTDFVYRGDESNTEAINGSTQDYTDSTPSTVKYRIPGNLRPRQAVYKSADGATTRRCVALTSTIFAGLAANAPTITIKNSVTGADQTLSLRYVQGERLSLPQATDTGLNDGDAS